MKSFYSIFILIVTISCNAQVPTKEEQIGAAVQSVLENDRDGAKVYGYDPQGKLITLRDGNNEMICIADDHNIDGFSVACYHKTLEMFMDRGRELKAESKNHAEIYEIREREVRSGKLKMPKTAATLHVLSGPTAKYNKATGLVENANLRYVVYIPYATAESTGLPLKPAVPGGPWIMDPGTHRAHIMVTPPAQH